MMTVLVMLAALLSAVLGVLPAQQLSRTDTVPRARSGAEFRIPALSFIIPGFGQYLHGSTETGLAFTATAIAGYALYYSGDPEAAGTDPIPRHASGQQSLAGLLLASGAGELSAYDSFQSALPALRREGKYQFVSRPASTTSLLLAPFDWRFLGRWTTWIDLAQTVVIAALILGDRESGVAYEPFTGRDAGLLTLLSMSAGAGEEALFRGWLLPVLTQTTGEDFWLANGLQAGIFGAAHLPDAEAFALYIAAWAFYQGWLTRRNQWDIRESVFQHFWYDLIIGTADFLTDERATVVVRFPSIRF
jgi:membrane protease YdiL (CAAX protease family)